MISFSQEATRTQMLDEFVTQLGAQFAIKDLGPLNYFLGIQVQKYKDGIFLSQSKYITDLLHNTNMADCKPVSTPMSIKPTTSAVGAALYFDVTHYRQIFAFSWAQIVFRGVLRNNPLSLVRVQKLNIGRWLTRQLNSLGYLSFFVILVSTCRKGLRCCFVIMFLLFT